MSKAYVSPLCWYGAGLATTDDPRTVLNRCTEACRQIGCNRREWESCALGSVNANEISIAQPGGVVVPGQLEVWKEGGAFMEDLLELFETSRQYGDWAVPITGTRLLESARAYERYANTTMPRYLSENGEEDDR